LVKRDPTALTRAALGPAKSLLGSFVVITLTRLLLEVADQLCVGIVQAAGETTESMGDKITILAGDLAATNIAAPGVGAIITTFLAGLAITAAAVVWLSLLVRKALLLVAIVFASLALSGFSWDATRGWIPKWAMFVATPICSLPNSTPPTAASTPITATTPTRGPTLTTPSTCSPTALKCTHGATTRTDGSATKPSSPRSTSTKTTDSASRTTDPSRCSSPLRSAPNALTWAQDSNKARTETIDDGKDFEPCAWGGARGIRTPDLLIANETRYQLRHSPGAERS
jgi:hypothetical protein